MALLKPLPKPEAKVETPKSVGEVRRLIRSAYRNSGWNARDHQVNCELLGIEHEPLAEMKPESLRVIYEDMVKTKMILVRE